MAYGFGHSQHAPERAAARCGEVGEEDIASPNIPDSHSPSGAIAGRPASMSPSIRYGASGFQDLPHAVAGVRLLQMSLAGVALRTIRTPYARA